MKFKQYYKKMLELLKNNLPVHSSIKADSLVIYMPHYVFLHSFEKNILSF